MVQVPFLGINNFSAPAPYHLNRVTHPSCVRAWRCNENERIGNTFALRRVRFKLADKIEALELLGKHYRLYVNRHEHDFRDGLGERLARALARVGGPEQSDDADLVRPDHDPPRRRTPGKAPRKRKRARPR